MARRNSRFLGVLLSSVPQYVKNLSDIGINYDIIAKTRSKTYDEVEDLYSSTESNNLLIDNDNNPYFSSSYNEKRDYLRKFSGYPEIEYILDCICDDSVIMDKNNHCCNLDINKIKFLPKVSSVIEKNFEKVYSMIGFDSELTAWNKYREWLVDGAVAYEIVYDYKSKKELNQEIINLKSKLVSVNESLSIEKNAGKKTSLLEDAKVIKKNILKKETDLHIFESYSVINKETGEKEEDLIPTRIIGFVELDPQYLTPVDVSNVGKLESDNLKLWRYTREHSGRDVILSDNQIIYINYYDSNMSGNISYVERLLRNFNLKRKMEDSTVGWFIMHSQSRLKMIVPIGNKTADKAKQALRNLTNHYQEDLIIDFNTGEITINGRTRISYAKNIVLPSRNGTSPQIDTLQQNGPDLSNMKVVDYFDRNLRKDSRLPQSRYDRDNSNSKVVLFKADGVTYEDLSYNAYLKRMRTIFSEILMKPLFIQCILDIPELKIDPAFKTSLGFVWNTNFMFEEVKDAEILKAKLETIRLYDNVKDDDDKPVFSKKFLYVTKYKLFTEDEWEENVRIKNESNEEKTTEE